MFSLLAWLRVFAFTTLLFTAVTNAREDSLFTSSVTYCNPPETLLISRFDVAYFPGNQSISFNVSAASVQANVNVTANLLLNVYGMKPVNVTLDLCNILGGALCPLPMYNFTGADSITLPSSLGVASKIPGIAFKIPDLEGFAQLTLTEVKTGAVKACVQATLSNGWSTHQTAVEWSTGGVAIAALILSVWLTLSAGPDALAPFRFLELMYLYQTIASSALLNLNYPSVYRAFALNFAWAIGLFPTSESSSIQGSINTMRHQTGGQLADSNGGSVVQFVNRRLSPYNTQTVRSDAGSLNTLFRRGADNFARGMSRLAGAAPFSPQDVSDLAKRETISGEVQIVTADSSNVLQAGLPIYVNSVSVSTANAFMTVFICLLMLFALGLALLGIGYGAYILLRRRKERKQAALASEFNYLSFARSWLLRLALISLGPLLIFVFYQWTLKDSWASILLSVLSFIAIMAPLGYVIFTTMRFVRQSDAYALYTPGGEALSTNAPLYAQYRPARFYFFIPLLVATFLRAIFIAFAKSSAEAQIALMIIVEFFLVASHFTFKPYHTKGGDVFSTYLAIVRLVTSGLMIAFLQKLNVTPIPRVVIGIVIVIIFAVAVLVVIINFVLHLGIQRLWSKQAKGTTSLGSAPDSEGSVMEKGTKNQESNTVIKAASRSGSVQDLTYINVRPHNPTPEQSTPIDNSFLHPYPVSPTGTIVTSINPSSVYSRDSASLTVGSLLPRRWSFTYSQPNSPTGSNAHGNGGESSLGHGWEGSVSRRASDSTGGCAPSLSPSAWRPGSSSGSSGHITRASSVRALQQYQQHHCDIPEHEPSCHPLHYGDYDGSRRCSVVETGGSRTVPA